MLQIWQIKFQKVQENNLYQLESLNLYFEFIFVLFIYEFKKGSNNT